MKSSKLIVTGILCSLGFGLSAYGADSFKIDPVHSSVLFSIKHLGVTDFYGGFNEIAGTVSFDSAAPSKSSVQLTVPVESLATRNPKRDQHLKSPDFFNAKQFPTLAFKSTKVEGTGTTYKVTGDFSLHGVTKPVTFVLSGGKTAEFPKGVKRTGFSTDFVLKRSEFGVGEKVPPTAAGHSKARSRWNPTSISNGCSVSTSNLMTAPGSSTGTKNVSRIENVSPANTSVVRSGRASIVRTSVSAGISFPSWCTVTWKSRSTFSG